MSPDPTLVEELVVLSYRRDTRKRQFRARDLPGSLDTALQAAVIVDLIASGRVGLVRQQAEASILNTYALRIVTPGTTGIAVNDAVLAKIADDANRGKPLSWWLARGGTETATERDLIARGLVTEHVKKFGPFTRDYRFEPVDLQFDAAIRDRFEAVFFGGHEPTHRDLLIAAILSYGWIWHIFAPLTDNAARNRFQDRVESLAARQWPPAVGGDPIVSVLTALSFTHSGSGH